MTILEKVIIRSGDFFRTEKREERFFIEIIKNRLKAYSVESVIDIESNNINIKIENKKNKINSIAIEKLISKKGNLNFVPTYNNTTLGDKIFNISNRIISKTPILSFYLYPNVNDSGEWNESPILGNAKLQDTAIINNYLKRKQLTDSLPNDLSFNWATEPSAASDYGDLLIDLYLIKKSNSESLIITNTQIEKVKILLAELQLGRDMNSSIAYYQNLLKRKKDNPGILNNLAWAQLQVGQISEAINSIEKAYSLASKHPKILDTYANILVAKGDVKKALELF